MWRLNVLRLSFTVIYTISCASLLGRTGDKQVLSLQRYGCVSHGIIQHETLHALGFYHEHTRSDRDQYIKINWDNINPRRSRCRLRLIDSNWYSPILIDFFFFFGNQILPWTSKSRTQIISTLRMTTPLLCTTEGKEGQKGLEISPCLINCIPISWIILFFFHSHCLNPQNCLWNTKIRNHHSHPWHLCCHWEKGRSVQNWHLEGQQALQVLALHGIEDYGRMFYIFTWYLWQ